MSNKLRVALLFGLLWTLAGASPAQTVQEDDYARLVDLKSPAVSPDATRAAVVVSRVLWNDDKRSGTLVLVDLATGANRTLIGDRENVSDPAFSPDGSRLAFLARAGTGKDAHTQVFVMPLDGGDDAHAVTHSDSGVDEFVWRPDGRALAYAAADSDPPRSGADRFRDSFIFTTEPVVAREAPRPSHLFTVSLDGGAATQLTFGAESASD
ncbi:MAG TPA: hypothetical protein VN909_03800, partial [Candidatus Dormibacteraeota bacterium]|nr:hypothetical protein [Candidatus Dormibacteraeota bacterium]